jgi:hypothetical protein
MTDTLAQLVTKLQALLLGDANTFTTATCTAAIRQAFKELNISIPTHAAETMDVVAEQYEYELSESSAMQILDVLLEGTDTLKEYNVSIPFDGYFEDDRPFIRLRIPQSTGRTLIVRFTKPYTINGLDSATVSTMPALYDAVLLDGAAWMACLIRTSGTVETINMNQNVSANFQRMADHFRQAFENGLVWLARRQPPVSVPVGHGWDDEHAGQY